MTPATPLSRLALPLGAFSTSRAGLVPHAGEDILLIHI